MNTIVTVLVVLAAAAVAGLGWCFIDWWHETRSEMERRDWIDPKHDRPELDAPRRTRPQRGSRSWE